MIILRQKNLAGEAEKSTEAEAIQVACTHGSIIGRQHVRRWSPPPCIGKVGQHVRRRPSLVKEGLILFGRGALRTVDSKVPWSKLTFLQRLRLLALSRIPRTEACHDDSVSMTTVRRPV